MVELRQVAATFGRFLTVGLGGTVVNLGSLAGLATLKTPNLLAALIATEIAIIHNFLWNDAWTFKKNQATDNPLLRVKLGRFGRFQLITALTASLSLGLFSVFNAVLGWHYLLAQLAAIGFATVLNFGVNAFLTWGLVGRNAILTERNN